ncbi:MAG TPA: SRPBCC family protein [Pseudonocardia sp.]|jgi:hypothetical protein
MHMIHNVHQREFVTSQAQLGELLDRLAGQPDPVWPPRWPPVVLDGQLAVGASGGHGPIHYRVASYQPGRRVLFEFEEPTPLAGSHDFEVLPGLYPGSAVLRHVLTGQPLGLAGWLGWTLLFRWLHDALLEDLLDRVGAAVGDPPESPARWSRWVRLCRWLVRAGARSATSSA